MTFYHLKTLFLVICLGLLSFTSLARAAHSCDPANIKSLKMDIAIIHGQYTSTVFLAKTYHEMAKEAAKVEKISSSLALGSGLLMSFGNFAFSAAILRGTAASTKYSKIMSLPIVIQLESATQISGLLRSPLSVFGVSGLHAIGNLLKIGFIQSDKVYAITKGLINIFQGDELIQLNTKDLIHSEEAYQEALERIRRFRYEYIERGPGRLENGLSFGAKAAAYTKNLEVITIYEGNLAHELYLMKKARYIIEKNTCDLE